MRAGVLFGWAVIAVASATTACDPALGGAADPTGQGDQGWSPAHYTCRTPTVAPGPAPSSERVIERCKAIPEPENQEILSFEGCDRAPTFECQSNKDCTTRTAGYCRWLPVCCGGNCPPQGTRCFYAACTSDLDCGSGSGCVCGDEATRSPAPGIPPTDGGSRCMPSECRSDAECPDGRACSYMPNICPDRFCGVVGAAPEGLYCHTAADSCAGDSDCAVQDHCIAAMPNACPGTGAGPTWHCGREFEGVEY